MACCHDGKACLACTEALRAEKVRVLEEALRVSHYSHEPGPPELGDLRIVRRMLSEARAMDHGFCNHKPRCPSGPPSEQPTPEPTCGCECHTIKSWCSGCWERHQEAPDGD